MKSSTETGVDRVSLSFSSSFREGGDWVPTDDGLILRIVYSPYAVLCCSIRPRRMSSPDATVPSPFPPSTSPAVLVETVIKKIEDEK